MQGAIHSSAARDGLAGTSCLSYSTFRLLPSSKLFHLALDMPRKQGLHAFLCSHLLCVNPPLQSSVAPHHDKRDPNQDAQMPQQANQMYFFAVSGLHPSPTRARGMTLSLAR